MPAGSSKQSLMEARSLFEDTLDEAHLDNPIVVLAKGVEVSVVSPPKEINDLPIPLLENRDGS